MVAQAFYCAKPIPKIGQGLWSRHMALSHGTHHEHLLLHRGRCSSAPLHRGRVRRDAQNIVFSVSHHLQAKTKEQMDDACTQISPVVERRGCSNLHTVLQRRKSLSGSSWARQAYGLAQRSRGQRATPGSKRRPAQKRAGAPKSSRNSQDAPELRRRRGLTRVGASRRWRFRWARTRRTERSQGRRWSRARISRMPESAMLQTTALTG